jgi:hypothetical protein
MHMVVNTTRHASLLGINSLDKLCKMLTEKQAQEIEQCPLLSQFFLGQMSLVVVSQESRKYVPEKFSN